MNERGNSLNIRKKHIPSLLTIVIVIGVAVAVRFYDVAMGTLIALTGALIGVVWYAYWTYKLVVKRESPAVAATIIYVPTDRDIRVRLMNPTKRYAGTSVWLEITVYGQQIDLGSEYRGKTLWHLTPLMQIEGHRPLKGILGQVGKNFEQMCNEANDDNANRQLRLSLKVEWTDEQGVEYKSPKHWWYFDFRRKDFVYQVGGFS